MSTQQQTLTFQLNSKLFHFRKFHWHTHTVKNRLVSEKCLTNFLFLFCWSRYVHLWTQKFILISGKKYVIFHYNYRNLTKKNALKFISSKKIRVKKKVQFVYKSSKHSHFIGLFCIYASFIYISVIYLNLCERNRFCT